METARPYLVRLGDVRSGAHGDGGAMTTSLALTLAALALVDSTSFGTLLIPIWLMLTPGRPPVRRVLVFLGTIGAFYLLLGLALVAGASAALDDIGDVLDTTTGLRIQLVVGVLLLGGSFLIDRKDADGAPGRISRWRERLVGAEESGAEGSGACESGAGESGGARAGLRPLVLLALTVAALEVATMLPYLGATGLISRADLSPAATVGVLAAYCLVMLLPALLLLALRTGAHRLVAPVLARLGRWLERTSASTTAWIVGIVGFLVARDAVARMPGGLDALIGAVGIG